MSAKEEKLDYNIVSNLGMKFVISCTPFDSNISRFIELWKAEGVKNVVRVCASNTYNTAPLQAEGITVHEMEYKDGTNPPPELICKWLQLVDTVFPRKGPAPTDMGTAIAVHCVAGLGRAPALVVIALIERGMDNLKAAEFVRHERHNSINVKQLEFLRSYKPKHKECLIM